MKRRVIVSDGARSDVRRIIRFIERTSSRDAAKEWWVGIQDRMYALLQFPDAATPFSESSDPDTRVVYYKSRHGIVYAVFPDCIVVKAVYDCRSPKPPVA